MQEGATIGRYHLGGFHSLSSYRDGQLAGNHVLLSRLTWYMRLANTLTMVRGLFIGRP